jgi:Tfp pilus assembly protein PilF
VAENPRHAEIAEQPQRSVESFKSYHRTHAAKTLQAGGKAAVDICRRVTEIDPRDAKAWFNLGVLQGKLSNPHEKIRSYRKAVEADHNFGVMLNAVGKTEEGNTAFARARKLLNPKFPIAETIEFKSATMPDGAPIQPTSAPPV